MNPVTVAWTLLGAWVAALLWYNLLIWGRQAAAESGRVIWGESLWRAICPPVALHLPKKKERCWDALEEPTFTGTAQAPPAP